MRPYLLSVGQDYSVKILPPRRRLPLVAQLQYSLNQKRSLTGRVFIAHYMNFFSLKSPQNRERLAPGSTVVGALAVWAWFKNLSYSQGSSPL